MNTKTRCCTALQWALRLSSSICVALAFTGSAIAGFTFSDPGPVISDGPAGDPNNGVLTFTHAGAPFTPGTLTLTGTLTSGGTGTFSNEARVRIINPAGQTFTMSAGFTGTSGATFTVLSVGPSTVTGLNSVLTGTSVGLWTFRFFESFNDAAVDATWTGLTLTIGDFSAPACASLGTIVDTSATYAVPDASATHGSGGAVVWYCFTTNTAASGTLFFDIDTEGSTLTGADTELGLYDSTGALRATDDDDGSGGLSQLSFGQTTPVRPIGTSVGGNGRDGTLAAGTYWLAVAGFNATFAAGFSVTTTSVATGTVIVNLRTNLPPPPANNACASPTIVPGSALGVISFTSTVDTRGATTETSDPLQSCTFGGPAQNSRSAWYSFTPDCNRSVAVDTCTSSYDTVLTVHTGACGAFSEIACNDDGGASCGGLQSGVTFSATAGTTYTIEVTAFSATGAGGTLVLHVIATDTAAPSLTCPANIGPVECTSPSGAAVTFSPAVSDSCDASPTVSCVPSSGSTFGFGTTTVNCTASDHSGNAATPCSFTVTVVDTTAPSITCPSDISAECDSPAGAVVSFSPSVSDVCDASPAISCAPASGSTFSFGTTSVSCFATDDQGNSSSTCMFNVTVADTTAPTLSCPASFTETTPQPTGKIVNYTVTVSDVCDPSPSSSCTPASGSNFPIGTTTVNCSASDSSSNTSTCMFDITIILNVVHCVNVVDASCSDFFPTIQSAINASNPGDTVLVGEGTYGSTVHVTTRVILLGAQHGVDACSRPTLHETILSEPNGPLSLEADGIVVDGFTLRDADGSLGGGSLGTGCFCTATHSGYEIRNNIFTNNTFGLYLNSNGASSSIVEHNKFDDNNLAGPAQGSGIYSDQGLSNATIHKNCFTNHGNTSVLITYFAGAPHDLTFTENKADNRFLFVNTDTVLIDGNLIENGPFAGIDLFGGCDHYTITCNTLRNNGQSVSRPGVFFRDFGDGANSDFEIHTNNILGNTGGGVMVTSGAYTGGNVDAASNWWGDPSGPFNATNNPGGTGNEVTDDVDFAPVLTQPTLVITCPSNAVAECTSPAGAAVTYGSPTPSSLCDANPTATCVPASGSTFPIGTTTVTCSAIDRTCATASCNFTVTVVDTTAPTPTCPANTTAECTSPSGATVTFSATAVDTCDASPSVICVPASGSTFPLGTTTVTCTATDSASNSSNCQFTVTVVDTTAPTPSCPAPITAVCTGPSGASVSFTTTATDACDPSPTVVCTPPSGSTFSLGSHTVNCTATDSASNSASCSFTVTVVDVNPPTITCSSNLIKECTSPAGASTSYSTTAVDDCDTTPSVSCSPASGSTFPLGTTTVNCTATDDSGNGSTCSFTVLVRDTTPPSITCSSNLTRECTSPAGATVTFSTSSVDACDPTPTIACSPSSGSTFPIGTTTVNCSATDDAGNSSTCAFNVTVRDTTAPSITCPGTITTAATSGAGATVNYNTTAVDTCDTTPTIICNPPSGSTFPIGTTTVTCNASDDAGNVSTCSFLIRVTSGIQSVLPNSGKQTGGELVNIFGSGFTNVGDTTVTFGGSAATVVSVTSTHIQVRTPAGLGLVNVTVTNSFGSVTSSNAFNFIDPAIAARFGNVNVGAGDRFDVLFINNTAGNSTRDVFVPVNTPIRVDMATSPSRVSSRYALYVWTVGPTAATLRTEFLGPYNLGCLVLPGPLNQPDTPQPRKILNNTDQPSLGTPNFNSFPAPVTIAQRPGGLQRVRTLTLQGIIQDDASQAPSANYAMTNAIILHVTP